MPSPEHARLVQLGARWLKKQGFAVIETELTSSKSREQPDVIGFRASCSVVIEVKVSRSDFLADQRKPERMGDRQGLGNYRFYLCPAGLLSPQEVPSKWCLLEATGAVISETIRPLGNAWPGLDTPMAGWAEFQHASNLVAERSMLFSIARRHAIR